MGLSRKIRWACILALLCVANGTWAGAPMKVGVGWGSEHYIPVVEAIYKEAGITFEIKVLPGERSLKAIESGELDADAGRVAQIAKMYSNLEIGSEQLSRIEIRAATRREDSNQELPLDSLAKLKVGMPRGFKFAELELAAKGAKVDVANNMDLCLKMLAAKRFDVALFSVRPGAPLPQGPNVAWRAKPLASADVFHVVHKSRSAELRKLDAAIKALRESGRLEKLFEEADLRAK